MFVTTAVALLILSVPSWERIRSRHRRSQLDEHQFYAAVHAEMRGGASLRRALADAAAGHDAAELRAVRRAASSGAPIAGIAAGLRSLPGSGDRAAVAVRVAARSGGMAADVFLRLADRASEDAELARQRRVLTTQARMSALIVGGLPLAWLALGGVGRIHTLVEHGGLPIVAIGLGMEAIGVALVWRLASK